MTIVANAMSRIDELTDEIAALRDRFDVSEHPERNDLRMELTERMVERGQLREFCDELKIVESYED